MKTSYQLQVDFVLEFLLMRQCQTRVFYQLQKIQAHFLMGNKKIADKLKRHTSIIEYTNRYRQKLILA